MAMLDEFLDPHTVSLLVEHYGGRRLCVPSNPKGRAWERLVQRIGEECAARVVRWFQGETIAVPMAANESPEQTIRNLRQAGMPVSEIARLGFVRKYSERHIHRICAAEKAVA